MFNILNLFKSNKDKTPEDLSEKDIKRAMKLTVGFLKDNPQQYSFMATYVPGSMVSKACLLGWIGYFLNRYNNTMFIEVGAVGDALYSEYGHGAGWFYGYLNELSGKPGNWQSTAKKATAALEQYIKVYRK